MPAITRLRLRVLALGLTATGCTGLGAYEAPCYDDSACENGTICRGGECVLECVVDRECPATAPLCEFNRCTPRPSVAPDAGPLPDLAPLGDFSVAPTPDAAVDAATPDAAVAPTPDAAVDAATPDAAVAPTPDAAVAPTPDAAI